jgi:SSS family solute:Na+ symporter
MKNLLPLCIVVVYMLILYVIAWYSTKLIRQGGARGFFLANRGFPAGIIAVMLAGLAVGGASTVGVAQDAYTKGLSAGMYNAAWGAGAIVAGLLMARRLRNVRVFTLTELLGRFYGEKARFIGVFAQLIIVLTIVSLQYVAGGAILTALLSDYFSYDGGMAFTAVAFVGICIIGGYWAAGLSNLINVIVIYLGLIFGAVAVISGAGGMGAVTLALPEVKWFSFFEGMGWTPIIVWFTVMITQTMGNQGPMQIAFAARDGETASRGFILGGLIILPAGFISAIFGITAAMKYPGLENSAMALPTIVLDQSPLIAGFILAGLWAADVSTAVGLLLGGSTMILRDIITPLQKRKIKRTPAQEMFLSRILVLVAALVTFLMAMQVRSVLATIMIGLSLTAPFTIILLGTLYFPRYCRKSSAFWCLVVGVLVLFAWQLGPASWHGPIPHLIFAEWIACLASFCLVAVLDKNKCPLPEAYGQREAADEN